MCWVSLLRCSEFTCFCGLTSGLCRFYFQLCFTWAIFDGGMNRYLVGSCDDDKLLFIPDLSVIYYYHILFFIMKVHREMVDHPPRHHKSMDMSMRKKIGSSWLGKKQVLGVTDMGKSPSNTGQLSEKNSLLFQKKRRLSLNKGTPMEGRKYSHGRNKNCLNYSIGIDQHLAAQKYQKALKHLHLQQYSEAAIIFKHVYEQGDPFHSKEALKMLLTCYRQHHRWRELEQGLSIYIGEFGEEVALLMERARVRVELGAIDLAMRDYKSAIYLDANTCTAYLELADCLAAVKLPQQAIRLLEASISNPSLQESTRSLLKVKYIALLIEHPSSVKQPTRVETLIQQLRPSMKMGNILYLQGKLQQYRGNRQQACICYEQSLKYNSSEFSVTQSMKQLLMMKIQERDYYSAYHTVKREQPKPNEQTIKPYRLFLEGVIMLMKRKFKEGCATILQALPILPHSKEGEVLEPLCYKLLGYGYFCTGEHGKSVQYYRKLQPWGYEESSKYNLLLAEGILEIEQDHNTQMGIQKFNQAKFIYPSKAQPYLYIGMAIIYRALQGSPSQEQLVNAILHALDEFNIAYEDVTASSSNLLFHRTILNLFLGKYDSALDDINHCIEKAEENLPKYFYLRGLTYSVLHNLKKAINEHSICLSLDPGYEKSLVERAKCSFLMGDLDGGFGDLKNFLQSKPDDASVHLWIGDLLYEGRSYHDALKAYLEVRQSARVYEMKCRCLMRTAKISIVRQNLQKLAQICPNYPQKITIDLVALEILTSIRSQPLAQKDLSSNLKKLNRILEQIHSGHIFMFIDCMNLLSLGMFYLERYQDAYQSLLLVYELWGNLERKDKKLTLRMDDSEEDLDLGLGEILFNLFLCLIGMKQFDQAIKLLQDEFIKISCEGQVENRISRMVEKYKHAPADQAQTFTLSPYKRKNIRTPWVEFHFRNIKLKSYFTWSIAHEPVHSLYSDSVARKLVFQLKPSYIDNQPQGPWIKRNQFGVVFTGAVLEGQGTQTLLSTMRDDGKNEHEESANSFISSHSTIKPKRQEFKQRMMLDPKTEQKINQFLNK